VTVVLVTGANGLVGRHAIDLAVGAGHAVIAHDPTPRSVAPLAEARFGDLSDPEVRGRVLRGVDHVLHVASSGGGERYRDQLGGLLRAAEVAGARRFVLLSTALVYGEVEGAAPLPESHPVRPDGPIGRSALAAEEVLRAAGTDRVPWTILRAAPTYGRGLGSHLGALLAAGPILRLGTPVLPHLVGGPRAHLVHAEDVARAALHVLEQPGTHGEVVHVADEDPLPLGERLTETFQAYGLPTVPLGELPRPVLERLTQLTAWEPGGQAARTLWSLVALRHGLRPRLSIHLPPEVAALTRRPRVLDATRLRGLGWRPRFPRFADGFRDALSWFQREGWVPTYR
jgi:nucleoside-diphosphate-sugar epimerase